MCKSREKKQIRQQKNVNFDEKKLKENSKNTRQLTSWRMYPCSSKSSMLLKTFRGTHMYVLKSNNQFWRYCFKQEVSVNMFSEGTLWFIPDILGIGGNNSIHFFGKSVILSNSLFAGHIGKRCGRAIAPRNLGSPYRDCRLHAKYKNPKSSVWLGDNLFTYQILIELIVAQHPQFWRRSASQRNFELVTQPFSSVSEAE